jgi:HSP20 family molecular chaperone IbpA
MTSFDLINSVHKQFFDKSLDVFDSAFDSWSKVTGFPFWNVVKYSKGKYGLELGLAGFKKENVLVEVNEGVLTIEVPNEAVVDEATMEDGMLKIQFGVKEIEKKSQKVNVK